VRRDLDTAYDAAVALLAGSGPAVLLAHVNPDGDALGSALGLALALRSCGRQVSVSFGTSDGWGVPGSLGFLPGQELLVPPANVLDGPDPALLVTLDTGSRDRLGRLVPLLDRARDVLVVDHHASNAGFGTALLLDPAAAATAVLVEELVRRLGAPLDTATATCLYAGLVTDTGQFQFAATTPAVHALAGRLLAAGVRPDEVGQALFGSQSFAAVRLEATAVARAALEPGLVWTWVEAAERAAAGVPLADVEGVIDALRVTTEAEVAVVLKGLDGPPDGAWAVSTRSRGAVDVGAACVALGGGGHRFAAGATLHGSRDEVLARVRAALPPLG